MEEITTDMRYVPGFTNAKGLMWLLDTIHAQHVEFMEGTTDESGWCGDAGYGPLSIILPRFKSFIVIGGTDVVFGFTSKSDRDCVLSDYIPDKDAIPAELKEGEYGSAMLPKKK